MIFKRTRRFAESFARFKRSKKAWSGLRTSPWAYRKGMRAGGRTGERVDGYPSGHLSRRMSSSRRPPAAFQDNETLMASLLKRFFSRFSSFGPPALCVRRCCRRRCCCNPRWRRRSRKRRERILPRKRSVKDGTVSRLQTHRGVSLFARASSSPTEPLASRKSRRSRDTKTL